MRMTSNMSARPASVLSSQIHGILDEDPDDFHVSFLDVLSDSIEKAPVTPQQTTNHDKQAKIHAILHGTCNLSAEKNIKRYFLGLCLLVSCVTVRCRVHP
jgi:hypothetical protein